LGRTDGKNVITGWQEGAGLHVEAPLYSGGRHRGERSAEADVEGALADAQTILDAISLQVNLAYRGAVAASERIDLSRTAVVQARKTSPDPVRYRNRAMPRPRTSVDSETALNGNSSVLLGHLHLPGSLARLEYAVVSGRPARRRSEIDECESRTS